VQVVRTMLGTFLRRTSIAARSSRQPRYLRKLSSITNSISQLNNLLVRGPEKSYLDTLQTSKEFQEKDLLRKIDLAVSIRDQYVQLPPSTVEQIGHERYQVLLHLANDKSSTPSVPSGLGRSRKSHRDDIVIDFILSRDVQKGIEFIIAMRKDLFQARKIITLNQCDSGNLEDLMKLQELDSDLKDRLQDWFCTDMMEIRRISYDHSSAAVIESIKKEEAVLENDEDFHNRFGEGKRVFALFSPLLPERPLVFCHIALSNKVPRTLGHAVASSQESGPTIATFYSITNGEPGLIGLQLGLSLLARGIQVS